MEKPTEGAARGGLNAIDPPGLLVPPARRCPTLPRNLPDHPLWDRIAPLLIAEDGVLLASGKRHRPIEVCTRGLTEDEIARLAAVEICCAVCGKLIQPLRRRSRNRSGRMELIRTMYVALSCDLVASSGCSRSKAGSVATQALVAAIGSHRRVSQTAAAIGATHRPASSAAQPSAEPPNQLGLRGLFAAQPRRAP